MIIFSYININQLIFYDTQYTMNNHSIKKFLRSYYDNCEYRKTQDLKQIIAKYNDKINVMEICYQSDYFADIVLEENKKAHITSFECIDDRRIFSQIQHSDRNEVILGNTKHTLLKYIEKYPLNTFDIMFLYGNTSYENVIDDMNNCFLLANKNTIVIMDIISNERKRAWNEMVYKKKIRELYTKNYRDDECMNIGEFIFTI